MSATKTFDRLLLMATFALALAPLSAVLFQAAVI
jgi:hypothetical protein